MKPAFFAGLDLGQAQDHSALAIIERKLLFTPHRDPVTYQYISTPTFDLRHIERIPLGVDYTAVAERVAQLRDVPGLHELKLAVDATGVGKPVVDFLRTKMGYANLVPVVITAGHHAHSDNGTWYVPKKDLVTACTLTIERAQFRYSADLLHCHEFESELANLREFPSSSGHVRYGPAGDGHDDLFMAFALALWRAHR
ncbi:MAG: hypothetical protein HYZ37_01655 [Candidatus Solibacter usitatus]|nr:hypothetical protein [Candidatus Solibacter usitatus]